MEVPEDPAGEAAHILEAARKTQAEAQVTQVHTLHRKDTQVDQPILLQTMILQETEAVAVVQLKEAEMDLAVVLEKVEMEVVPIRLGVVLHHQDRT